MQAGIILCLRKGLHDQIVSKGQFPNAPVSQCQIVGVGNIFAVDLGSSFERCDGLAILAGAQIKPAELMIRFEAIGSPCNGSAQFVFRLSSFACPCASSYLSSRSFARPIGLERQGLSRERFAGSQTGVRSMATRTRPVGNSGYGKA